jgi:hypothetical protein
VKPNVGVGWRLWSLMSVDIGNSQSSVPWPQVHDYLPRLPNRRSQSAPFNWHDKTKRGQIACHNLNLEAIAFLESMARAYTNLKTLSVEMRSIIESGDETPSSRKSPISASPPTKRRRCI